MDSETISGWPTRFGFLLLNDFTLISLSSAIEPLRMANRVSLKPVYSWRTLSESGEPVAASDGLVIRVDHAIQSPQALDGLDAIIVCGGEQVEKNTSRAILQWLRLVARRKLALGAVCTGSYALAEAGLLDGYRCSIHWENMVALTNLFPQVAVSRSVFCIDRDRITSSGGTTPVDMMLHLIGNQCGRDVSVAVAEQFIYERIRHADEHQRVPLKHFIGQQSRKLVAVVELMEANIREPIKQLELAAYVELSRRQLQRLFQRYLMCTPSRYYSRIKLQRARELLRQTKMSLIEISELTGFESSSHLSRSYKEYYGHTPSSERRPAASVEAAPG